MKKSTLLSILLCGLLMASTAIAGPYTDDSIPGYIGPAGDGIAKEDKGNYINPIFVGWATGVVNYSPSDELGTYGQNGIGSQFSDPAAALGPLSQTGIPVVSMGDMDQTEIDAYLAGTGPGPATLTLSFDAPIVNGSGADFAAFENGFVSDFTTGAGSSAGEVFAELGYVEVSTDGTNFARFPSTYLNYPNGEGLPASTDYLTLDVSNIHNLVGQHVNNYGKSWGTAFDLEDLVDDPLVLSGLVNLDEINYVSIVDIPGNGTFTDTQGNGIYDAWVTWGSGGLDFDALGVINQEPVPIPAAVWLLGSGLLGLVGIRRKVKT
jgi:hypothetical protein